MNSFRKNYSLIFTSILLIVILLSTAIFVSAQGTSAGDFFKGKKIDFIVPNTPGGGFDTYSRLIAPFIEKYIPGVTVVVGNHPGAGGIVGTNMIYLAKPDGLTIGIVNVPGTLFAQIGETEGLLYDLATFSWLARIVAEPRVLAVSSESGLKSMEDLKNLGRPVKVALAGVGSDEYFGVIVIFKAFDIPINMIAGYGGQSECNLALMRGEVDCTASSYGSVANLIASKDFLPILQLANEQDVIEGMGPNAVDVVEGEARDILGAITNVYALDRSICGPPGLPEDILKVLRDAVFNSLNDPEFLEIAKTAGRLVAPLKGSTAEELVKETVAQSEKLKDALMEVYTE